jgi:hypothetical protein
VQRQFRQFKAAMELAPQLTDADLSAAGNGRLQYDSANEAWQYCAGQYFPVEFRHAALSVLKGAVYNANKRLSGYLTNNDFAPV